MKRSATTLCILLMLSLSVKAQDVLTKRSGEELNVKLLEISDTEIKYKKSDNLDGPVYILNKADAASVRYSTGKLETFERPSNQIKKNEVNMAMSSEDELDMFVRGQQDAGKYYDGYKTAATVTFCTGLASPIVGAVPAVIFTLSPPKDEHLGYPNARLFRDGDYNQGYRQKARRVKNTKVWTNLGIAFGINLVLLLMISATSN